MRLEYSKIQKNQDGLVSIIVAILIMLLLTLIVLAMAQNSRREQRETLDRQLSGQAFYNAESGINDTRKYFSNFVNAGGNPADLFNRDECDDAPPGSPLWPGPPNGEIDGPSGVNSYSCLLWDLAPPSIEFDTVQTTNPEIAPIELESGSLQELTIGWHEGQNNFGGCSGFDANPPVFPASYPATCDAGILHVELVDGDDDAPSNLRRDLLKANNYVAFFVPRSGPTTPANTDHDDANTLTEQGRVVRGNCNSGASGKKCQTTIRFSPATNRKMYLVLRSIYKENSVTITGQLDGPGSLPAKFKNSQALIDSTGNANGILRRLQVRIPILPKYDREPFAIRTNESLCKLLNTYPGYGDNSTCP